MKKATLAVLIVLTVAYTKAITITLYMNHNQVNRNFLVHLPPGFSTAQQLPVVINMHGYGSDAAQQEFYSRMSETSDANNFIVCYPNGLGNQWNAGFVPPYNGGTDDVGFISKIIDTLYELYNVDLTRVYACGMSNGGFQSYRLACDLENRIAAIASVTGCIAELTALNCALARKVPVLHIHGTEDPLVPYSGQTGFKSVEETISFWLGKNQCNSASDTVSYPNIDVNDSSTVERIHYATCGSGTEVMFYKITGGGHTWPNATFDYIYGPTNRDFDASQEIWNFFNRFTLNGPTAVEATTPAELTVKVFPNPVADNLEVQIANFNFSSLLKATLFDVSGREIQQQFFTTPSTTISTIGLASGMYFLQIGNGDNAYTFKLFKE